MEDGATLESEHFYYINACRAKEKSGPFTDVLSYNSNDGVITDQEPVQIQQRKHPFIDFDTLCSSKPAMFVDAIFLCV